VEGGIRLMAVHRKKLQAAFLVFKNQALVRGEIIKKDFLFFSNPIEDVIQFAMH